MLSIIILMSLLVVLMLSGLKTGLIGGTATIAETEVLEPAKWEFERPSYSVHFDDRIERFHSGEIWINQSVTVTVYTWRSMIDHSDALGTRVIVTASVGNGFIYNVNVTYLDDYIASLVTTKTYFTYYSYNQYIADNLTKTDLRDLMSGTKKCFIDFRGVNNPQEVHLDVSPAWILESPSNQTQQLTVLIEVTYFNGTVYKGVVQPFQVRLVADDDNSFEKAKEIAYNQTMLAFIGGDDRQDFYKIFAELNDSLSISMTPDPRQNLDLYLYNSKDDMPRAVSSNRENTTEHIDYQVDETGWWFIEVERDGGDGIYSISVTVLKRGKQ